jgi:hypothetical protein
MRGIARTAALAATCDIADAPPRAVRPHAQGARPVTPSLRAGAFPSVELGTGGTRTGGDAWRLWRAPGPKLPFVLSPGRAEG